LAARLVLNLESPFPSASAVFVHPVVDAEF
jgi:hypothetical protein